MPFPVTNSQDDTFQRDLAELTEPPSRAMAELYSWLAVHWLGVVAAIAAGLAIYVLLNMLRRFARRLCEYNLVGNFSSPIGRAVTRTYHLFTVLLAARLVVGYASPPDWLYQTIRFLFTVVAAFQVAMWGREIILGLVEQRTDAEGGNETLGNAMGIIRLLVTVALFAIAIIVVLDNLGVNVTGLVAGLGIGGIAIGLAAQGIFSDLFAALSIIFDKPFRIGDTIAYDTTIGTVEKIGLKSTRLRAITGERKIISNTQLLSKEVTSYALLNHRRLKFAVGVIYQTPPAVAARIPDMLREIVEANGAVFVRSGFVNFGPSSLEYEVEYDVFAEWETVYATRHRIGIGLLTRFGEEGIDFAYPTQTTFTAAPDGTMVLPYPGEWATKPPRS